MRDGAAQSTPAPGHILLVDDNRLGLVARKSVLEELGYRISIAAEGHSAMELFTSQQFDLVITDYKMPKVDGLELIRRIRATSPDAPVILISGYADALGLTEENTGADAVISKSANEVTQMVRAVNRLLRRGATPKKGPGVERPRAKAKRRAQ